MELTKDRHWETFTAIVMTVIYFSRFLWSRYVPKSAQLTVAIAWMYRHTNSITSCMAFHFFNNLLTFL